MASVCHPLRVSTGGPPSGVVTFLFTDIEGSTRRWEEDADAMGSALVAHDKVLRTAIQAHDGFLFSHTGDGVVAAFASAARRLCFWRRCLRIHPPMRQSRHRPRHHRRPPRRKIGGVTAKAFGATAKEDMAEEWEPYHWAN